MWCRARPALRVGDGGHPPPDHGPCLGRPLGAERQATDGHITAASPPPSNPYTRAVTMAAKRRLPPIGTTAVTPTPLHRRAMPPGPATGPGS